MNFASAIGRTTVGLSADRIGFLNAFILTVSISAISQAVVWNLATDTYTGVIAYSAVFGLTGPCYISLITPIAVTLYGTQSLATLTGLLNLASLPGGLAGPPIAGLILDGTHRNWHILTGYSGLIQFTGVLCILFARFKRQPKIFAKL
ncbi:major facilitator superfamily transporter [Ceratobasidium sp. AG-Ba]|nr:major facilitator superfamily transporter [Ceratobasidium sp. AG-Ba]